jgi:hypothetical protein
MGLEWFLMGSEKRYEGGREQEKISRGGGGL